MVDIQLGAHTHTLRSHGRKVARFHMHDWIILVFLGIIDIILNVIEPFHRFVGRDMMTDLRYPLKSNTVPFWAVPLIAVVLPVFIFISIYFKKQNVYDLHNAILGLLFSVLITGVLTDAIKDAVGRPRPDFFWRCFPDGIDQYDNFTTSVICHGEKSVIKEGHKSFPSGHSSWSFAGLSFLAWYLAGKIRVFDRKGHVAKVCLVLLPLLCAALIAISRVDDYWHHWQDDWWFLQFVICSSSHPLTMQMVGVLMRIFECLQRHSTILPIQIPLTQQDLQKLKLPILAPRGRILLHHHVTPAQCLMIWKVVLGGNKLFFYLVYLL